MTERLPAALARAGDDIGVCCGTPRDCLVCWCTPVAGWAGAIQALDAEQKRHYPIRPTKQGREAIRRFCEAMLGEEADGA